MPLSAKSLAGPGYIILNAIRVMNIIALLAVIIACVIMLVKITTNSQFYFFDGASHVITACVSIFLIVSELTLFRAYFARHWPLFSPTHGFVALALAMEAIGVNMLANLNKPALSQKNLGTAFWRIVIGAGILIFIIGFFNLIASYVFRARALGVTARQVRAKGAVALIEQHQNQKPYSYSSSDSTTSPSASVKKPMVFTPRLKTPDTSTTKSPIKFPQFGRRPNLPSYHTSPVPRPASSHYSERGGDGRTMEISGPIGINPQFAHLVRPDVARPDSTYHPARRFDTN